MDCPQCKDGMIETKATAFGDSYWYCRTCKKELSELTPKKEPIVDYYPNYDHLDTFQKPGYTKYTTGSGHTPWVPAVGDLVNVIDKGCPYYAYVGIIDTVSNGNRHMVRIQNISNYIFEHTQLVLMSLPTGGSSSTKFTMNTGVTYDQDQI